jgi:hypothetical protein
VWPNLFLIFDCPSSVYTDHDLFRTLSKWISVDIRFVSFWRGLFSISRRWALAEFLIFFMYFQKRETIY